MTYMMAFEPTWMVQVTIMDLSLDQNHSILQVKETHLGALDVNEEFG
jgi:hypothetical protein